MVAADWRMSSLWTPVLSSVGSFYTITSILLNFSLCNLLGQPRTLSEFCFSGHSWWDVQPYTTYSNEVACGAHRSDKTLKTVALCKPILGFTSFDVYNFVQVLSIHIWRFLQLLDSLLEWLGRGGREVCATFYSGVGYLADVVHLLKCHSDVPFTGILIWLTILDIIHCPVFLFTTWHFKDWILSPETRV
jgi:hypothetical protein